MTYYVLVESTQDSALYLEGAGAQQTTTLSCCICYCREDEPRLHSSPVTVFQLPCGPSRFFLIITFSEHCSLCAHSCTQKAWRMLSGTRLKNQRHPCSPSREEHAIHCQLPGLPLGRADRERGRSVRILLPTLGSHPVNHPLL